MKKLFLTSGEILSMLGQASASTDIADSNNTYDETADCTHTYLDTYESSSSLEAKWDANISGKITLNDKKSLLIFFFALLLIFFFLLLNVLCFLPLLFLLHPEG